MNHRPNSQTAAQMSVEEEALLIAGILENDYREHRYQTCQRAATMLRKLVVKLNAKSGGPAGPSKHEEVIATYEWGAGVRDAAIEECAMLCDLLAGLTTQGWGRKMAFAARKCATEIRALKRSSATEERPGD